MNLDEQLRRVLREDAGDALPPTDGWDDVVERAAAHTRRRRTVRYPIIGVAAAAATALIVAGAVALRSTSESEAPSIASPSGAGMPDEIVSVINESLVVLDARTGRVLRTLAGPRERNGPSDVSVAPGGEVYFVRSASSCDVRRVELSGEDGEGDVTAGSQVAVSPDGRWLAYTPTGDGCSRSGLIGWLDLVTGTSPQIGTFPVGGDGFELIGWSDADHVVVRSYPGPENRAPVVDELPVPRGRPGRTLDPGPGYPIAPLGATGRLLTAVPDPDFDGFRIVVVDPTTGERTAVLGRSKRGLLVTLSSDPSGRHLLYWVTRGREGQETLELWRRTVGEEPVKLRTEEAKASGGLPAVWVP